jgi:penicillin-binding protein 2
MAIEDLVGFAAEFGLGRNLVADIPSASVGLLPDPAWKQGFKDLPWYPGDSVNMGIGQGDLLVTPMQMALVASVIANRGGLKPPRMVADAGEGKDEGTNQVTAQTARQIGAEVLGSDDWEKWCDPWRMWCIAVTKAFEATVRHGPILAATLTIAWRASQAPLR